MQILKAIKDTRPGAEFPFAAIGVITGVFVKGFEHRYEVDEFVNLVNRRAEKDLRAI